MDDGSHAAEEPGSSSSLPMSLAEYARYGRQMIVPGIGLPGQLKLRSSRVLVVGAGGLGCPSIQYLAAAGVGYITVVDHDVVESSNLARQILHTDARVGMSKARSVAEAVHSVNPHVTVNPVQEAFTVHNAIELSRKHDVVLDCTDNALTRYLISDAAVLTGRQVVSGAAQGLEGQLITLHRDMRPGASCSGLSACTGPGSDIPRGPCYRCLFPKAPKPDSVTDCEDGGVLGTVTGLVGTMQALETINLLLGLSSTEGDPQTVSPANMTLVAPLSYPPFRTIKVRSRRTATCRACGDPDQMDEATNAGRLAVNLAGEDYVAFCGLSDRRSRTEEVEQIDVVTLSQIDAHPLIVDVRPQVEFEIANLPHTCNLPIRLLDAEPALHYTKLVGMLGGRFSDVYVICRRGNDSILACHALTAAAANAAQQQQQEASTVRFVNVTGGLRAWSREVDTQFPVY